VLLQTISAVSVILKLKKIVFYLLVCTFVSVSLHLAHIFIYFCLQNDLLCGALNSTHSIIYLCLFQPTSYIGVYLFIIHYACMFAGIGCYWHTIMPSLSVSVPVDARWQGNRRTKPLADATLQSTVHAAVLGICFLVLHMPHFAMLQLQCCWVILLFGDYELWPHRGP